MTTQIERDVVTHGLITAPAYIHGLIAASGIAVRRVRSWDNTSAVQTQREFYRWAAAQSLYAESVPSRSEDGRIYYRLFVYTTREERSACFAAMPSR